MIIRIAERSDFDRWREFLLDSPQAHVFQSTIIADFFRQNAYNPLLLLVEKGEDIIGGLMSFIQFGNFKLFSTRFFSSLFSYHGPIFSESETNRKLRGRLLKEILQYIDQVAKKEFAVIHEARPILYTDDTVIDNLVKTLDYTQTNFFRYTFLIDLNRTENELWKSLERECRRRVSKAERSGVIVTEGKKKDTPKMFYQLYVNTLKRRRSQPKPYSFIEAIWRILVPIGRAKFFFAYYENNPIAGCIILTFKEKIYGYLSGSLKRYWHLFPNNLLQWHVILDGKRSGYEFYDLMYSPGKEEKDHWGYGLHIFKKSFGGNFIPIGSSYKKIFSPRMLKLWDNLLVPAYNRFSFYRNFGD